MELEIIDGNINKDDLIKFIQEIKIELKEGKKSTMELIQNWLDAIEKSNFTKNQKRQKKKELIDLGYFLSSYNTEIKIIEALGESPDFLIQCSDIKIGIELCDLVIRPVEKAKEGTLKKLFSEIEIELKDEINSLKGAYKISFKNKNQPLKRDDRIILKEEIINCIKYPEYPKHYIKEIRKTPYSKIHLYYGQGTCVGHLEKRVVIEKIGTKEINFNRYVSNSTFEQLWLLLVIGGVQQSDDYSFMEETIIKEDFTTQFDKIFIFDFFKRDITELKTIKPE